MKKVVIFMIVAALFASCGSRKGATASTQAAATSSQPQIVGADRDEHGCIGSAGYTWSEVMKDCIRIFEKGVQMKSAIDPQATLAAYVVFAPDSTRAEVYLPSEKGKVLERRGRNQVWEDASGKLTVMRDRSGLMIHDGGKMTYRQ